MKKNLIIIVPARKGSSQIKNKNLIKLNGYPLIYYTINIAKKFIHKNNVIFCSTNSKEIKKVCENYGLEIPFMRPNSISKKLSRDLEFVNHALNCFWKKNITFKYGLILRPTSPVRNYNLLKKAFSYFKKSQFDSMRAIIELNTPIYKMWLKKKNNQIISITKSKIHEHFNAPRQILPKTYYQTSNFEFFRIKNRIKLKSISGNKIGGYLTNKKYDHDIDNKQDIVRLKNINI